MPVPILNHLEHLKLIAIATTARERDIFLAETHSENNQNDCRTGVELALRSRTIVDKGTVLGYEILGYDCGWFCSFVCNSLEKDFVNRLGIKLNQYGLIPQYNLALIATEYTTRPTTGAEPVLWLPWTIIELDI